MATMGTHEPCMTQAPGQLETSTNVKAIGMIPKDRLLKLTQEALDKAECNNQATTSLDPSSIKVSQLCRLWGGMGHIYRVSIPSKDGNIDFALKHVTPPPRSRQSFGDRRKAKSYQVEANFYHHVASALRKEHDLALPIPYHVEYGPGEEEITICMSYLRGTSFDTGNHHQMRNALKWMAVFHASHWGDEDIDNLVQRVGLQEIGSYWHLETRLEEHASMSNRGWEGRLKLAAKGIDACLKRDPMQCLIHGDPKDANMMQLHDDDQIAMYDFQYCGKGSPTQDLAYFLCSSCDPDEEKLWTQFYYENLSEQLAKKNLPAPSFDQLQASLELAYSDFCRFMCGWGHWGYDLQPRVKKLLNRLDGGKSLGSEAAYTKAIEQQFW